MGALRLRDGVTFCQVDGRFVFLDAGRDRYFALDGELAAAFDKLVKSSGSVEATDHARLMKTGLVEPSAARQRPQPLSIDIPEKSLFDQPAPSGRPPLLRLAEISLLLASMRRARRRVPLSALLLRIERMKPKAVGVDAVPAARLFNTVRPWAPVPPHCLSDSLALSAFLLRRGVKADIVFGVKLAPFAAHAWVQSSDMVLNDHVDRIREYRPVLVV